MMKIITLILFTALAVFNTGCNPGNTRETEMQSAPVDTAKTDYSNVRFASQRDTTCHMPLSAGIGDTLHFDGKVYGFCSTECKDAFVKQLKTEKKL